ncbi:response regulator, partial [Labilibacter sediminis]
MARKITILYIEDDPASRLLVDRTLRYAGYHVIVAERGLEGIDIARSQDVDLILTDINLPDITGRELTTMLRSDERFESIPVVALTTMDYADQRDLAMAAGINGYMTRPLDIEKLPTQLEFYLGGGRDEIEQHRLDAAQS